MLLITLIFVLLYAGTFTGAIKAPDAVKDLQPIIFVIIGYYFGRLPSQQVESSLKEQVRGQANNAAAARNAERKAEVERGTLEEKIKNTRTILETGKPAAAPEAITKSTSPFDAAIKVLSS
jgi:hypothetical protein